MGFYVMVIIETVLKLDWIGYYTEIQNILEMLSKSDKTSLERNTHLMFQLSISKYFRLIGGGG